MLSYLIVDDYNGKSADQDVFRLLADHFQVRRHDLITWYRHMGQEMLELAQHYYDDITYTRFIFQLTGVFTVEEAAELNRL